MTRFRIFDISYMYVIFIDKGNREYIKSGKINITVMSPPVFCETHVLRREITGFSQLQRGYSNSKKNGP